MNQRKEKMLSVKMTKEEFLKIETTAKKEGYESTSAYVRETLGKKHIRNMNENDKRQLITLICKVQNYINRNGIDDMELEEVIGNLKEGLKKWQ